MGTGRVCTLCMYCSSTGQSALPKMGRATTGLGNALRYIALLYWAILGSMFDNDFRACM